MKKQILSVSCVVLAFILLFCLFSMLLSPKYATDLVEGGMIPQYYHEDRMHDVIFVGDCEVYANFSPMELYRETGITAYVRGSSQQLLWQSYSILEETLKYETPKVVILNINAMRYDKPVSEAYNRLTIDKMKWSRQKADIIRASMTEDETFLSYIFPILRYHSRFDELTKEDFQYLFHRPDNTFNGFLINKHAKPMGKLPAVRPLADYSFAPVCWEYLEKIRVLCEEHGCELMLIKAPSAYPHWYDEYDAQIQEYADRNGLYFCNLLDYVDEIGIDYQTDTYDGGLHLNLQGATKLSRFFAHLLSEKWDLPDHRNDPEVSPVYDEKLRLYLAEAEK